MELLRSSFETAQRLAHLSLEARCRVLLAQISLARGRFEEAAGYLDGIPPDGDGRTIGAELRAEVDYSWSRIRAGRGDAAGARTDALSARERMVALGQRLPEADRDSFMQRPTIRRYFQ
jgi:hypothetical protein